MFSNLLKLAGNSPLAGRHSYLRRKKIGAVLIEFAFAIPVFLVLIYYIHDLPKYKLMWRKMQFVSNIAAATIQNISKQKAGTSNPAVTQVEIANTMQLAFLAIYPGNTMINTADYQAPLGYGPHVFLYYVRGTGTNQASISWYACAYCNKTYVQHIVDYSQHGRSAIKYISGNSSNIYPDLLINSGEVKMIMECVLWYPWKDSFTRYRFSPNNPRYGNRHTYDVTPKEAFGFLMLNPKYHDAHTWESNYFYGVTIFTPIGFAFSAETAPK